MLVSMQASTSVRSKSNILSSDSYSLLNSDLLAEESRSKQLVDLTAQPNETARSHHEPVQQPEGTCLSLYNNDIYTAGSLITEPTKRSPLKRRRWSDHLDVKAHLNETFIITVEYGDDAETLQEHLFKVEGRHAVHRVLEMVCLEFKLEKEDASRYVVCSFPKLDYE